MKKILVINAHPRKESFSEALAKDYFAGAQSAGFQVELVNLYDLEFNPNQIYVGMKDVQIEADIVDIQIKIKNAEHLVFVYPNWWGTFPALLKGFIDRVFVTGFAFKYQEKSPFPLQLLKGKTARLIVTMDTPAWYYKWIYGKPGHNAMKKSTLKFSGIKPVKITSFSPIRNSTPKKRQVWLQKVNELGKLGK